MKSFRVLSALMAYPNASLQMALTPMREALQQEQLFRGDVAQALDAFIQARQAQELIHWQEDYVALFDRGRHLSLHLFEHVHGESRDRGQAMVELMRLYEQAGFALDSHELPDYLPLYLEFLSLLTLDSAKQQVNEALPVIALIGERLKAKGSDYAVLFEALEQLSQTSSWRDSIRRRVAGEKGDETLERMDEIWEEEAVRFMGDTSQHNMAQAPKSLAPSDARNSTL